MSRPRADLIRQLIDRHLPECRPRSVRPIGAGLENAAFDVDGDLVVRLRTDPDSVDTAREAQVLRLVAVRSPLPVPMPVLVLADEGCLVYRKLPGRPLIDLPAVQSGRWAVPVGAGLGGLLAALHTTPPEDLDGVVTVDDTRPADWLDEARRLHGQVGDDIPARHRAAVRRFLAETPPGPAESLAFSHNDLGVEHVLVDPRTGRITGVLDWTDAAICDPARDLSLVLRDLGPDALDAALASHGRLPPDIVGFRRRIRFLAGCALLEDLAYGLDSGAAAYVEKSLRGMEWLFPT